MSDDDERRATRLAGAFAPLLATGGDDAAGPAALSGTGHADAAPAPATSPAGSPGDEPAVSPTAGRPARPAETELSLDRVFRDPRPSTGARSSTGFSFDQFFSKTEPPAPSASAPRAPEHGEVPAAGADDIAQFNAWLQGLKTK